MFESPQNYTIGSISAVLEWLTSKNEYPAGLKLNPELNPFLGQLFKWLIELWAGMCPLFMAIRHCSLEYTSADCRYFTFNRFHFLFEADSTYGHQSHRSFWNFWSHHGIIVDFRPAGVHDFAYLLVLHGGCQDISLAVDDPLFFV